MRKCARLCETVYVPPIPLLVGGVLLFWMLLLIFMLLQLRRARPMEEPGSGGTREGK